MSGMELGQILRALRRRADLSQRQLADRAGMPPATVARMESGAGRNPSFRTVERLLRAAGAELPVVDAPVLTGGPGATATAPVPVPHEDLRDAAGRRYPAHLDITEVTRPEKWWGAWWTLTMIPSRWPLDTVPPYTYDLSRYRRDERRARTARGQSVRIDRTDVPGPDGTGVGWIWLAYADEWVGELRAHRDERDGVTVDGVVVAPNWRGCGVGRRLIRALLAHAAGARVTALSADYGLGEFLRACGFEQRGAGATRWVAR